MTKTDGTSIDLTRFGEPILLDAYRALPEAAPIAAVIDATKPTRMAFALADQAAQEQQTAYRNSVHFMLGLSLIGALVSALALLPESWVWLPPASTMGSVQFVALLATFAMLFWIKLRSSAAKWLNARTEAERLRSDVFQEIMHAPLPSGAGAAAVLTAKLDVLLRCHVLKQHHWLIERAAKHKAAAGGLSWSRIMAWLLGLCVFVLSLPQIFAFLAPIMTALGISSTWMTEVAAAVEISHGDRVRLATTAALQALMGFAAALTEVDQDRRKANLYRATAKRLEQLIKDDIVTVEEGCARGDGNALRYFFRSVRTILEADHFAWNVLDPDESTGVRVGGGGAGSAS